MFFIGLMFISAFMVDTAMRDFEYGTYQFVFTSPISKRDYFFGKFAGVLLVTTIPFIGVSIGTVFGAWMPWSDATKYGPFMWSGHLLAFVTLVLPNIFIFGSMIFALTLVFRNKAVSSVISLTVLIGYMTLQMFSGDLATQKLAQLLDPFGNLAFDYVSKYLSVSDKNSGGVALSGMLLWNRFLWVALAAGGMVLTYMRFSFTNRNEKSSREAMALEAQFETTGNRVFMPSESTIKSKIRTFVNLLLFELKSIVVDPVFMVMAGLSLAILLLGLYNFTVMYGTPVYPITNSVVNAIRGSMGALFMGIIIFYSGVLVWRSRDSKMSEIIDSCQMSEVPLLLSKVVALILVIGIMLFVGAIAGVASQLLHNYTAIEFGLYLKSLFVLTLSHFTIVLIVAILIQYLFNNKNLGYFFMVAFILFNAFFWDAMEINSNMLLFNGGPMVVYSDMNGFGPFVESLVWFKIYWGLFSALMIFVAIAFYVRGKGDDFRARLKMAWVRLVDYKMALIILASLFLMTGGYIYYNTKVLNEFHSGKEYEEASAKYEKRYKQYENRAQPRIYRVNYTINLMPSVRSMDFKIEMWARNVSSDTISELYFTSPKDSTLMAVAGSSIKLKDDSLNFRILTLQKALLPNDSVLITASAKEVSRGFENTVSNLKLTNNGTFFMNKDICPTIGYVSGLEISDKSKRKKYDLPTRLRTPLLDESDMKSRANCEFIQDADWVNTTTVISTEEDQIAIAPGSLVKEWKEKGRNYYQYEFDHASLNFYSFISARYEVARKKWNGVDLEVYYHKDHPYNVDRMLLSMEKSLDYYTKNFGPYFHKQARILEFPKYQNYAQSYPGTMPYSEGMGFILDLRKVKEDDIDQVFYVVAHEMGHQYWAHQVVGASMQGSPMLSEGFSQYSALMVMEKEYGRDKMKKFLKYELDGYFGGRAFEQEAETPLVKCEGQQYIHYKKASVVMYYMKEMVGEEKVNSALKSMVDSFAYKSAPYPTSLSAIRAFRKVTPDSLQYLIDDMFEHMTLFSNRALEAKSKAVDGGYEVTFKATSEKFRTDSLGKESVIPVRDYVDVVVFGEPNGKQALGDVLVKERVLVTMKDNTFTYRVKEKPVKVGIDPYNYLIDKVSDDNLIEVNEAQF